MITGMDALLAKFPPEFVALIRKHEAEGTTDAQGVPGRGDAVLQEAHMHGRPVAGRAEPVVRRVCEGPDGVPHDVGRACCT